MIPTKPVFPTLADSLVSTLHLFLGGIPPKYKHSHVLYVGPCHCTREVHPVESDRRSAL